MNKRVAKKIVNIAMCKNRFETYRFNTIVTAIDIIEKFIDMTNVKDLSAFYYLKRRVVKSRIIKLNSHGIDTTQFQKQIVSMKNTVNEFYSLASTNSPCESKIFKRVKFKSFLSKFLITGKKPYSMMTQSREVVGTTSPYQITIPIVGDDKKLVNVLYK